MIDDVALDAAMEKLALCGHANGRITRNKVALAIEAYGAARAGGEQKFLIWSNEHNAWWRPNSQGYTHSIEAAGRYSLKEAISVSNQANYGWSDMRDLPNELPISEEAALLLNGQKDYRTLQKSRHQTDDKQEG